MGLLKVSHMTHTWTRGKQHLNKHNSEYQLPIGQRINPSRVQRHQHVQLHTLCEVQCGNITCQQISRKRDWPSYHKNTQNKQHYSTLAKILYATNLQNTISKTSLKNYYQFRRVRTESPQWFQLTTYLRKLKFGTDTQHRVQQLLDFITTEIY